jgi:hypothetical protein
MGLASSDGHRLPEVPYPETTVLQVDCESNHITTLLRGEREMAGDIIHYICVGLPGISAEGLTKDGNTFSLSGCRERTAEDFVASEKRNIADGALVIDKVPAIHLHGPRVVFMSPMPNIRGDKEDTPSIAEGDSLIADVLASQPNNAFGMLVRGARAGVVNLDTVPLDTYVAYWRKWGARIGRVRNGGVVWE